MSETSIPELLSLFDRASGVTTDSRKCGPGMLYVALKGERFDGNAFALDALDKGCIGAVVDNASIVGDGIHYVTDGLTTLQQLARAHRRRFEGPVFGLTGSNGKTTTKELIKSVLGRKLSVHATVGNLNNHIGVPLTLLSLPLDAEFALIEMGANHQGEIAALCAIAEPTHGMITNVGLAHLEGFGGVEGVKKGKQELYKYLAASNGTAIVNAEDPDLMSLSGLEGLQRIPYGNAAHPPHAWRTDGAVDAPIIWAAHSSKGDSGKHPVEGPLKVHLQGAHQLANMQAAIAVGHHFGVPKQDINVALEAFQPVDQRGEAVKTAHNHIIVDCYNANPSSVESTLRSFASSGHNAPLAILGDMKELGEHAAEGHRMVMDVAHVCGLECWTVGMDFHQYAAGDRSFASMEALRHDLEATPLSGRTILLKGSRSMRMERLVEVL